MMEEKKFYGKYRGVVVSVLDPERRARILVQVPAVYKDSVSGWAEPCLPLVGLRAGLVALPQLGAAVWVEFEQGDPERPIWSGGFWQIGACPSTLVPLQTLLQTATGHSILIDDTPGTGGISLTTLTGDTLKLSTATGALLQTVVGHKIEINPAGITLQTVTGNKLMITDAGIELATSQGASVMLAGNVVLLNKDGLVVM